MSNPMLSCGEYLINHNLDESEYNYLKGKLNVDKALVNITDWYNEALADK